MRVRELDGSAVIKNSNGDTWVGAAGGDLRRQRRQRQHRRRPRAAPSVVAKTANGDVRLGEVVRGSVVLETAIGDLEVGIREGTAAWLDVQRQRRQGAQRARRRRGPRAVGRDRRGARPHVASATSSSGRPMTARVRDHGDRPAQVLRRPPRARRRRPRRRRGHDLRAARPQRRRQDHDRPDPLHPDRRRRAASCGSPATTSPATPTRSARRSASPASSRPSTTCSPARRT